MFHQETLLLAVALAICRAYVVDKNSLYVPKAVLRLTRPLNTADNAIPELYESYIEQNYKCISEGRFEDPNDCGQYYDCIQTDTGELVAHKKSCFGHGSNTTIKACAQTDMVKGCSPSPTESLRSFTFPDPTLLKVCKEFKNEFMCSDCKTLVMCVDSRAYSVPCGQGLLCSSNQAAFTGGVCYPDAPSECTCNKGNVFRKDIYNPSKFLSCDTLGSEPEIHTCPRGSVFNEDLRTCGTEAESTCSITGSFAIMGDCNKYYTCILTTTGWLQKDFTCIDSSKMFNDKTGICEDPCDWYTGNFKCKQEGRFANPGDCKTFYECINDPLQSGKFTQVEHMCPKGFEWGPMANRSFCVASSTTTEECVPSKPNNCKIPSGWCSNTTEIDECLTLNGGCDQICTNTPGSFVCSCQSGYDLGDYGKTCTDIDECSESDKGGCDQICTNTPGSFVCSCQSGYELGNYGKTCTEIDECSESDKGGCAEICTNTLGSFVCSCQSGYDLGNDGKTCTDINECSQSDNGGCDQLCDNTAGSFDCSCESGYDLENDGKTCAGCVSPWITLGSSGCFFFSQDKLDWDSARSYCQNAMGDLGIFDSESKLSDLNNYFYDVSLTNSFWAGLTYRSGSWLWLNNNTITSTAANWYPEQPDYEESSDSCVNVRYRSSDTKLLVDWGCSNNARFVCQK